MLMLGLYTAPPAAGVPLLLDATPLVTSCVITTNAHGFESLTASLKGPLRGAFQVYDQPGLLYVGLRWGGQIVWEGRLEDPSLAAGGQGSGLSLSALGAWRSLSDDVYTALWSKTTVGDFRPLLNTEVATTFPDRFAFDTQNRLYITPQKNATLGNTGTGKSGMLAYQLPDDSTRDIIGAQFAFTYTLPAANWRVAFQTRDDSFAGIASPWLVTAGGAGTVTGAVHVTFAAARVVNAFMDFAAADAVYAPETGANFLRITNLRLVTSTTNRVNTTLTANRAAGANVTATVGSTAGMYVGMELVINSAAAPSEIVTVLSIGSSTQFNATFVGNYVIGNAVQGFRILGDEIVKDAVAQVSTLNSSQLSSSTALIQSPGLDLTDRIYEDAAIGDIISGLADLGDGAAALWEVGVYEGRLLFFRPKGTAGRAWFVDASDLSVARSLEQLHNSIYAVYEDANGVNVRSSATSDATAIARYGVTRRQALQTQTTSAATAQLFVNTALADSKDPKPRTAIQFDAVYDTLGSRYPLWLVRSGDTITIRNLSPNTSATIDRIRTFRVTHTSYDCVADTLAVEPEEPPPTLEVMLARRQEGVPT